MQNVYNSIAVGQSDGVHLTPSGERGMTLLVAVRAALDLKEYGEAADLLKTCIALVSRK